MSDLPLKELRIVVTRPERQADSFEELLSAKGALPVSIPVIKIDPIPEVPGLVEALNNLDRYAWVIFTSVNGVEAIKDCLDQIGRAFSDLSDRRIAAIGPATAESLKDLGVEAQFVPDEYVGEKLGEGVEVKPGDRVFLPRAKGSRPALPRVLEERGAAVDEFGIYQAIAADWDADAVEALEAGVDALTFTSPSTVRNFIQGGRGLGLDPLHLSGGPIVACIGPITGKAASEAGYQVTVVADKYTIPGFVDALCEYYQKEDGRMK